MSTKSWFADVLGAVAARFVHATGWSPAEITTREIAIGDLSREFDGYTIVVLSDFHHAPMRDAGWMRHVVDTTNAISPDLIALLGDYATSFRRLPFVSRAWYRTALSAMKPECARLQARDGIVAVLGNHDYYADVGRVQDWLQDFGADVLVNRARLIQRGGSVLRVAGVDDIAEGDPDTRAGCHTCAEHPTIVLSHNPDSIMHLAPDVRVDVMLAGHTHGGQVVVPWYGAPLTMSRVCGRHTASGWVSHERTALYVTRGLGAQVPLPVRLNCPPELLVLRLRTGSQHPA